MPSSRSGRALVTALTLLAVVAVVLVVDPIPDRVGDPGPPPAEPGADPSEEPAGGDELRLTVADPDPSRTRYDRDEWMPGGWAGTDGDGCDTRAEVLIGESTGAAQVDPSGCGVVAGDWLDPYSGLVTSSPGDLEIDHLVALADAHRSGGWRWPAERKEAFANDLDDADALNAMESEENQAKPDDGPDAWEPEDPQARCTYVTAYARIKARWELTVTEAQASAIEDAWDACPVTSGR